MADGAWPTAQYGTGEKNRKKWSAKLSRFGHSADTISG
jgi:hypothetical protein